MGDEPSGEQSLFGSAEFRGCGGDRFDGCRAWRPNLRAGMGRDERDEDPPLDDTSVLVHQFTQPSDPSGATTVPGDFFDDRD